MEDLVNPDASFWRGRCVLLTGHTGFKGAWLLAWLSRMGAIVHGLSLAPARDPNLFSLGVKPRHGNSNIGDIRDLLLVQDVVRKIQPQIVFHLAAQSLVRPSYRDPVGTYATNVMGTVHVLEAVRSVGSVEAVVVVTSDKCYENREWIWPYRETDRLGGHDPYSNSKGCAEMVVSSFSSSFFSGSKTSSDKARCHLATVRAGNVIGGGDWSEDRLIPDIVQAFQRSETVEIRSPHAVRPWQHVLEPLRGYILLAEKLCGERAERWAEPWNFGPDTADCQPVSYIVDRLTKAWGDGASWRLSDVIHPHEATILKVDASKAAAQLGWHPRLGIDQALSWTLDWYKRHYDGGDAEALVAEQIDKYLAIGETRS